jgi:predicted DNA-binding ribbon-helix-helix protein
MTTKPGVMNMMKSPVIKRSIIRDGHKSSVSLEDQFWDGLHEIADRQNTTVSALIGTIDQGRNNQNLSSAIRVFVLDDFRARVAQKQFIAGQPHSVVSATSTTAATRV